MLAKEAFNPEDHMWQFVGYYKYIFTFCTMDEPHYSVGFGDNPDDIYRYDVWAANMSWDQITDNGDLPPVWKDWED